MNTYELRQEDRRERYFDRAEKARQESNRRGQMAIDMGRIMQGEPIKIGHHSEKRHRRDIQRMDDNMHRAALLSKKAQYYEDKADGVGKGGISSDDPEAVQKLKAKLEGLEGWQAEMKRINKQYRSGGWDAVTGLSETTVETCRRAMAATPWEKKPFPTYATSNNNANIKRIQKRIKSLETVIVAREPIKGPGFTITEHPDERRIWCEFDTKPDRETCLKMRRNGWRWSRDRMAWVRHLNANGRYCVRFIVAELTPVAA